MEFLSNINVIFYLLGYFIGGIPFGLLLAKKFADVDVTKAGSGAIGATNVLRVVKEKDPLIAKKLSIATIVLDVLKAVLVLAAGLALGVSYETLWGAGILAIIGHCFSPYLKFEGGKGVATSMGVFAFFLPIEAILGLIVWFGVGKALKISSLSSLLGITTVVVASFILHPDIPHIQTHAPVLIIAFLIFYKHIPNIVRLMQGKEGRVV